MIYQQQQSQKHMTSALQHSVGARVFDTSVTRRAILGAAVAGLSGAAFSKDGQVQGITMQCAGSYGEGVFHTVNLRQFAADAERYAKGGVRIDVISNADLMPMSEVLPALASGKIAFGEVLMSSYGAKYPMLEFDALPFVLNSFDQAAHMWEVTREPVSKELLKNGVRVLYAAPWPAQGLFSRVPVSRLEDLRGLRFRVYNETSRVIAERSRAIPVYIPANELPAAIESGKVDVMFTSSATAVDCQAWKCMSTFTTCAAWVPKNIVCVSEKIWQSMSEQQQRGVLNAARDAEIRGWNLAREADSKAQKILISKKIQIVDEPQDLRRGLDLIGERISRDWSKKAGFSGTSIFLGYYKTQLGPKNI